MKYFLDMENGKKFIAISIPSRYQEIRILKIITKNVSSKISTIIRSKYIILFYRLLSNYLSYIILILLWEFERFTSRSTKSVIIHRFCT